MSRAFLALCVVALLVSAAPVAAQQAGPSQLRVTVVDETGGTIPIAVVRVGAPQGSPLQRAVDDRGVATFPDLQPGAVPIHVEAEGFAPFDGTVTLRRGGNTQTITLKVAGVLEEVTVTDTSATDDRRGNALSVTLDEEQIADLSDDPDELEIGRAHV